ncbi:MAG: hypothetical protein ACOZNI_25825 [Myxococcota bacterium]
MLRALPPLLFLVSAWPTRPSVVDDAYVSLRYARNLALGNGLVYNAGEPPVEGYTDFLWVLLMAPGTRLPLHPATWATGWGLAFGALAVMLCERLAHALGAGRASLAAGLALALNPHFGIAASNGLETSMFVAGVLGAAWAAIAGPPVIAGLLAGSLYLVRPEGLAVGGALAIRDRRALAAFAAVVVPYFLARGAYFGTLVPNTYFAQARKPFLEMWAMNRGYFERCTELWVGGGVLLAGAALERRKWLLVAIAAGLVVVALRVYNWMPGGRLLLPSLAIALAAMPSRLAIPAFLWTAWLSFGPPRAAEARYDERNTVLPDGGGERLGREIAARAEPGDWLLARDAGVVPYFAGPDVDVIDIHDHSLTEPRLTGKPFDYAWLLDRDVAFLVTTTMQDDQFPTAYVPEKRLLKLRAWEHAGTWKQHHRRYFHLWTPS